MTSTDGAWVCPYPETATPKDLPCIGPSICARRHLGLSLPGNGDPQRFALHRTEHLRQTPLGFVLTRPDATSVPDVSRRELSTAAVVPSGPAARPTPHRCLMSVDGNCQPLRLSRRARRPARRHIGGRGLRGAAGAYPGSCRGAALAEQNGVPVAGCAARPVLTPVRAAARRWLSKTEFLSRVARRWRTRADCGTPGCVSITGQPTASGLSLVWRTRADCGTPGCVSITGQPTASGLSLVWRTRADFRTMAAYCVSVIAGFRYPRLLVLGGAPFRTMAAYCVSVIAGFRYPRLLVLGGAPFRTMAASGHAGDPQHPAASNLQQRCGRG